MRAAHRRCLSYVVALLHVGGVGYLVSYGAEDVVSAQTQTAELRFEVASIRRNTSGEPRPSGGGPQPNGRYRLINATTEMLIWFAYLSIPPERFVDAPGWIRTERYDVIAVADPSISEGGQFAPLLRALLQDRFHLRAHAERRDLPVFNLVKSAADGSLGPQLRRASLNCDDAEAVKVAQTASRGEPVCRGVAGAASMTLRGLPVRSLGSVLSSRVGRTVVDRTGLGGSFDIDLSWDPALDAAATPASDAASIYTALQEQLGLRLQPGTASQEVLVIDYIERPTEN